jgi:hypothetical protein
MRIRKESSLLNSENLQTPLMHEEEKKEQRVPKSTRMKNYRKKKIHLNNNSKHKWS